jgi:hypothetical protein
VTWVWFGVVRTSETPASEVRASFAGRCVAPVLWAWTTEEPGQVPESYRTLMYDKERYPSTLCIRVPFSIGPGLCRFLHVDFAEFIFLHFGE